MGKAADCKYLQNFRDYQWSSKKSQGIIKHKNPTFNIYDTSNCREILKGDLYFALLWQSGNTLKAINWKILQQNALGYSSKQLVYLVR